MKFISAIIIFLSSIALGQSQQDVLYLKDGSIIRGEIVEYVAGKNIKIETADGSIFSYPDIQIDSVKKEKSKLADYYDTYEYHSLRFNGGSSSRNASSDITAGVEYQYGWYFFKYLSLSIGTGIHFTEGEPGAVPLVLTGRWFFSESSGIYLLTGGGPAYTTGGDGGNFRAFARAALGYRIGSINEDVICIEPYYEFNSFGYTNADVFGLAVNFQFR